MYIHSVKMVNFKSIGEEDNNIILEPRTTAVIGKNESGKSNVLEGLKYISFVDDMNAAFVGDNINRNNGTNAKLEYSIVLKPNSQEKESMGIENDTQIFVSKESYSATGGLLEYYNKNIREPMANICSGNPFQLKGSEYTSYNQHFPALQQEGFLDIRQINAAIKFFNAFTEKVESQEENDIISVISDAKIKWDSVLSMLPKTFYSKTDNILQTKYNLEEVHKELDRGSLLAGFVDILGIPKEDFVFAVESGISGQKTSIRDRINRKVETIINIEFKKFYATEPISLKVNFYSNTVSFSVQSDEGETLLLSERSNGLRWYLNTFIDAKAHGISQSNVIYLFDEPGVSLHVNAQRELLKLFEDLADKGNQVVYTTHSPYMLNVDDNGIHRIRAIDKDSKGYTHIYKTAYDARLSPQNQEDTLAPIISAIGMTLCDTFGPAKDKLNIVTEGVSDYIYINTMLKILRRNDLDKVYIIPSFGVTNSINICNILCGWKCPFIAVFDFDYEGVEKGGEKMRNSQLYEMGKQYIYLKDIGQEAVDSEAYKDSPYMIEDLVGMDILDDYIQQNRLPKDMAKTRKTLLAKSFCNALEEGTWTLESECKERFDNLFNRVIGIPNQI